jgi:hypothetical protein
MNKVSFSVNFNTNLSKDSIELFLKDFEDNLSSKNGFFDLSFSLNFESSKSKIRVFEVPLKDVLNNLSDGKRAFFFDNKSYMVKMNSQRYFMFKENLRCVCCGLVGTRMFLEYHPYDMTPHFNLYGEKDDDLILMTKDHILAKALGGEDRHSNYQTMCAVCNSLKGHTSLTLESLKLLRIFFDENKDDMTKKQLHICLEKYKLRLRTKEKKVRRKIKKNSVILNCDLACFLDKKGSIYGRHIYEKIFDKRVGCMKKGTFLEPILEYRNEIICSLSDKNSIRILKHNLCYA